MLKRVMRSEVCVVCVLHVSTCDRSVWYRVTFDVLGIKYRVAMLVRESTYLRSSHGSRRRSCFKVPATHAGPRYSLLKCLRYST
jgi:hypothetical protein